MSSSDHAHDPLAEPLVAAVHHHSHDCGHEHYSNRGGWLRAGVMGATDGLVSTAGLMMGVAGSVSDRETLLISGFAGLVAGALSMAVGEFISVSSTRDSQAADVEKERIEQAKGPAARAAELEELTGIYITRGLSPGLARQVAQELSRDPESTVRAHARDELGIDVEELANPVEAMLSSLLAFIVGACFPLVAAIPFMDYTLRTISVVGSSCVGLLMMGMLSGILGGACPWVGATRVFVGGVMAMAITYGTGTAIGKVLG
eukprot:CAMPEP_0117674278 /NCGR_PEP_ID=MMETSP0804-20121206/14946_1 /TAXON_ID=1074897 /ORGANISM="Tetraselmis astigmatica, Strain CCMP880" /LENGTH=259 /DNA_ID=CAMNT_0005483123 /DNA_START=148 /DNA_END=927 /DNA_ORIENTATION=+